MIKQFVPSEVCLKCQGCCRFKELSSVWSPCLLDEEIISLIDKEGIPAASLSIDRRLNLIPAENKEGFLCPFLKKGENKCQIYHMRPFECQLYPFLLSMRDKKILLTVDLNCPYVKDKIKSPEFNEYVDYLARYLNSPKQLCTLKENPQVIQAYEDVLGVMELESNDAS
ncbi:MAG: YkgJ family cysteine cluster protein [Candidatus Omnitrophica bacterium]|nr:YkgJ family cysteine cluster protein [Candidatus Omnitrophota bacterium]